MTAILLGPLLLLLIVAFVYPIGRFLAMSVLDPAPTLAHFRDLLDRPVYFTILDPHLPHRPASSPSGRSSWAIRWPTCWLRCAA